MTEWYLTRPGEPQYGPYDEEQLREFAANGRIAPSDLLWRDGMADWVAASTVSSLSLPASPPPLPAPLAPARTPQSESGNKIAAGICGILLGALGVHKFILGMPTPGIIMLLVTLGTCGLGWLPMHVIGIIEGIIYLSKSDVDFYKTYVVGKRSWF